VHPDDASTVVVAAIGFGYAGAGCQDDGTADDRVGILTKGNAYTDHDPEKVFTDSCDTDGNLVEYYCESECTTGAEALSNDGWNCMLFGGVGSIRVTCDGRCLEGACVPLP
jgi:hypothetical protein